MPAVNSGRRVRLSPPRSSKLYISLETMSVVSPIERAKTSVASNTGISTRPKPYNLRTRSNAATTAWKRSASSPQISWVPLIFCGPLLIAAPLHFLPALQTAAFLRRQPGLALGLGVGVGEDPFADMAD